MSCTTIIDRKRKATDEVHFRLIPPRFISNKQMKQPLVSTNPITSNNESLSFAALPQELFCKVVAYIGPTSSSLCTIAQLSRYHRDTMKTIGDVMLQRATLRFRTPLPPLSDCESSVSKFVRHSRIAQDVHDNLEVLNGVLKKEFPAMDISVINDDSMKYSPGIPIMKDTTRAIISSGNIVVRPEEVDNALNLALCLLGAGGEHYSGNTKNAAQIAKNASTTALEWRVSSLCGKLGAKAYKYFKARILSSNEHDTDEMFSAYAVSDEMPLFDDESEDDQDFHFESCDSEEAEDMKRLDKASLVMQLVVFRDIEAARQIRQAANDIVDGNDYESWLRGQSLR